MVSLETTGPGNPYVDDEISGAESPPSSSSFAGGADAMQVTAAGIEAMQQLVNACSAPDSPEISVLAATAVQTAGVSYRANLLGVLREHGWEEAEGEKILIQTKIFALDTHRLDVTDKDLCADGNAFSCNMTSQDARRRLGADLALLSVSAVIPMTPAGGGGRLDTGGTPGSDSEKEDLQCEEMLDMLRAGARAVLAMNRFSGMRTSIFAKKDGDDDAAGATKKKTALVRQQSPFARTKAASVLERLDSDPLTVRDERLRNEQIIGSVIEKAADMRPDDEQPRGGLLPRLAVLGGVHARDGPPSGIAVHVRHGRITLFCTTRTHLQAMLDDNLYVKTYLQRVALETGTTIHEIDVGREGGEPIRELFRPPGRPPYDLPQVFFGTKWMGGASAIRNMEVDDTTEKLLRGLTTQDWIEIPFAAITLEKDQLGRAVKLGAGKSGQVYGAIWQGNKCAVKRFQIDEVASCIEIDECFINMDEFCIENDEFCIKNDDFNTNVQEHEAEFHAEMGTANCNIYAYLLFFFEFSIENEERMDNCPRKMMILY